ncbi:MAG: MotA/TolQ/ExbB proton channel family protein [Sandaracinaceae bacterium]|nr:MotA/TolQ/ExbB proton channel family protein [Sandaracinaceae bacterium]
MNAHGPAGLLRLLVSWLEAPVIAALLALTLLAVADVGLLVGERTSGLRRLRKELADAALHARLRVRVERSDVLARVGPMLGLMGTLVPLGPGLSALGEGDPSTLSSAVTVAFDTTVLGLLIGMAGFVSGRLRRRWYDALFIQEETLHE